MFRKRRYANDAAFLIAGAVFGGILAVLCAPKAGRELREDIKNEVTSVFDHAKKRTNQMRERAKMIAGGWLNRAGEILRLSKEYVGGTYQDTTDSIHNEFVNLRNAINAAVSTYRKYHIEPPKRQRRKERLYTTTDVYIDDEKLPKFESMRRRQE